MSNTPRVLASGIIQSRSVTPTITAGAYSSGYQVGGIQTLTSLGFNNTLLSVTVADAGKQSAALTIFFFNSLPTVTSSDNTTLNISDAQMAANCIGAVLIPAANYETVSLNSFATVGVSSAGLMLRSNDPNLHLYAVIKTTGTPTYASTSDLVFRYMFGIDE